MQNRWIFLLCSMLLTVAALSGGLVKAAVDIPAAVQCDGSVHVLSGGGGDGPGPFKGTNLKVELADGERYTLVGTLVFYRGTAFFQVDLSEHPWLANAKRTAAPYYQVDGSSAYLQKFQNTRLKWIFEARGVVRQTGDHYEADIVLSPLMDPVGQVSQDVRRPR